MDCHATIIHVLLLWQISSFILRAFKVNGAFIHPRSVPSKICVALHQCKCAHKQRNLITVAAKQTYWSLGFEALKHST